MRKQSVTRVSIALAALFAAASAGSAWRASAGGPPAAIAGAPGGDGGAALLFRRHCAACHAAGEFASRLAGPSHEGAAAEMLEFLADHGDASAADDARIVEHLRAIATAPADAPAQAR